MDVAAVAALRLVDQANPEGWGQWKLNPETRLLSAEYLPDIWHCVSVADILRDSEFLFLMRHLSQKCWMTDDCLGGLVRAGNDIRLALQEWLTWS